MYVHTYTMYVCKREGRTPIHINKLKILLGALWFFLFYFLFYFLFFFLKNFNFSKAKIFNPPGRRRINLKRSSSFFILP